MPKAKTLTGKELRFVDEYLIDLNAAAAGKRAGYADSTAEKKCPMWVVTSRDSCPANKRHIWDAVNRAKVKRSERTKVDADWLLMRLADEAEADIADLYNEEGSLKPIHEWPEIWRKGLVSGVDVHQEYTYEEGQKVPDGMVLKVRLSDRIKRLELIGKHVDVQAFKDVVEHSGTVDIASRISSARNRAPESK